MKTLRLTAILFSLFLLLCCAKKPPVKTTVTLLRDFPIGICFIREMDYIPEVEGWDVCSTEVSDEDIKKALSEWEKHVQWVESQVNPEIVKELSLWAKEEMKEYDSIAPLAQATFKPIRIYKKYPKITFEGTIDTLPTHSPIVTRWLKIYFIYESINKTILRATVTIRGEKLE